MHPGFRRELPRLANPIQRNQLFLKFFLGHIRLVGVGEFPDDLTLARRDLDRHRIGSGRQIVIKDGAVRRICRCGLVRRKRRIGVSVALNPVSRSGSEQVNGTR